MAPKKKNLIPPSTIRWTESDSDLIVVLREKTGLKAMSELLRQALRALAAKEGVTA